MVRVNLKGQLRTRDMDHTRPQIDQSPRVGVNEGVQGRSQHHHVGPIIRTSLGERNDVMDFENPSHCLDTNRVQTMVSQGLAPPVKTLEFLDDGSVAVLSLWPPSVEGFNIFGVIRTPCW
jgi:hypothetical protein